ncbi:MAG TPA: YggS family pyridoxal phosphate-dependent enzyme [Marmoricola sp.]|nr:YggS family pyridoxal phosphate-dependent enzyme [Marmoricola sp.]
MTADRRAELAASLAAVERRIATACDAAGRSRDGVTLVVVTKFFPASDVALLHDLGVRHVGESRHQEAVAKHEECAALDLTWHFIGHLQTNKAAAVGSWADVVQSVDRPKLLSGLARAAADRGRALDVLVQVSLDREGERGARSGAPPGDAVALAEAVVAADPLRLRGVMGVAPLEGDPAAAFTELAQVAGAVRQVDPGATWISAGMSGDLETAITRGATHVRVGSAVLGNRPRHG